MESVHDLCDAVQSGLLDDEALAKYFPDMKTVDIRKLSCYGSERKNIKLHRRRRTKGSAFCYGAGGGAAESERYGRRSYATKSPHWRDVGFLSDEPKQTSALLECSASLAFCTCAAASDDGCHIAACSRLPFASIALNVVLLVASMLGVTSSQLRRKKEISTTTTSTGANPQDGKKNWWPFTTSPSASASPRSIALASSRMKRKRAAP